MPDDTATEEQREAHQDKKDRYRALREAWHTILRLIGDHYRIPHGTHRSWQRRDLDLTGVTIDESSQRLGRHRWVVERTVSWLSGCRRLHRRYERKAEHFLAFVGIAAILIGYRRLAG
ncbi:transposase [Streptomyces sp. NPDC057298]|uniref:transposase n=1 Tax=Streptomyces sp. NPDC057298 TaxID=3346091 RepID=UPI0036360BDB